MILLFQWCAFLLILFVSYSFILNMLQLSPNFMLFDVMFSMLRIGFILFIYNSKLTLPFLLTFSDKPLDLESIISNPISTKKYSRHSSENINM